MILKINTIYKLINIIYTYIKKSFKMKKKSTKIILFDIIYGFKKNI